MINPYDDNNYQSDSNFNNDYSQSYHSNTWDSGIDSSFNSDLHNDYQDYHNHYSSNIWDSGLDSNSYHHDVNNYDYNHYDHYQSDLNTNINQDYHQNYNSNAWDASINSHGYNSYGVYNSDDSHSHVLTPDSNNGIDFSVTQNVVMWHGNNNYAGEIKGNSFYDSHGDLLGYLGGDMKIYDAHNVARGYVTPDGCAYDNAGHLFASGGTSQWAAATYVYNNFSPA